MLLFGCSWLCYFFSNKENMKTRNSVMNRKKMLEESIKIIKAKQKYINQNTALAVSHEEEKFCICTIKDGAAVPLIYNFADITGCEIVEDGVVVTAPTRNKELEEEVVDRIDLRISVNDSENPYVLANFLFWDVSKDSAIYHKTFNDAIRWRGIIENIVKKM